ncbi:MAG: hypothetical protein P8Q90_00770, partial [Candidatus Thalassarchaeaceae archaeon]|nr:hypothetical protein [Candidatus Thalassarchaeaceae archaeon]
MVKFNEKLSKMNKTIFLKELGMIFISGFVLFVLIAGLGSANIALFFLPVFFSVGLYQRWNAHT